MYNNDVGKESAQKFMKQTGDLKAATLYFGGIRKRKDNFPKNRGEK
jgi:hypothetical protein